MEKTKEGLSPTLSQSIKDMKDIHQKGKIPEVCFSVSKEVQN